MPTRPSKAEIFDLAAQYAAGNVSATERDDVERRLAAGDAELAAAVEELQATVEQLALGAPGPAPARLKDRLLAAVAGDRPRGFEEPEPGIQVLAAGRGAWRETGYPGVSVKLLHLDKQTRMAATVLRLAPGAVYPPHHHTRTELCLVLSGDARLGDTIHVFAGDFEKALPGSEHRFVSSDSGCDLLIVSSIDDEILAP